MTGTKRHLDAEVDPYRLLYERSRDIILIIRLRDGRILEANVTALKAYQYPRDELLSLTIHDLRSADTHPEMASQMSEAGSSGILFETWHRRKDGEVFPVEVNSQGTIIKGEKVLLSIIRDITDRKQREDQLRDNEQRLARVIQGSPIPTFVIGKDHRVIHWNLALEVLSGIKAADVIGTRDHWRAFYRSKRSCMADLIVEEAPEIIPDLYAGQSFSKSQLLEEAYEATDFFPNLGSKGRWLRFTSAAIRNAAGNVMGAIETLEDITDRKRMEDEIRILAITDPLTGLYNRRGFITLAEQQLKIAERAGNRLLILYADLDGMKWINDTLGHLRGDEALIEAADVFKEVFRESDIMARVGGDEFAVLVLGSSLEDSDIPQDRLQQQIDIHNQRENRDYKLSISIGTAYKEPDSTLSIDELMARADMLMYEEKKRKNSFVS